MSPCAKVIFCRPICLKKKHKQYDKIIITLLLYIIDCIEFQYHANIVGYYSVAMQKYACHTNAVIRVTTSKIWAVR